MIPTETAPHPPDFPPKNEGSLRKLTSVLHRRRIALVLVLLLFATAAAAAFPKLSELFVGEIIQEIPADAPIEETSESASSGQEGKPLPWEVSDTAGNPLRSSDLLGKPTILMFWTTWNVAAGDQLKILDELHAENTNMLYSIVAIASQENRETVANFIRRGGYRLRVAVDETGSVASAYEAYVLPATFFLDREGRIRDSHIGTISKDVLNARIEKLLAP